MANKKHIREEIRSEIKKKKQSFFIQKSPLVVKRLLTMDLFKNVRAVGCYLSVKKEVQTDKIFDFCRRENIKTFVPAFDETKNTYIWTEYKHNCVLVKGPFGIPQPAKIKNINKSEIDVFIVPGLAFDFSGARLGHGKGFFDRLLNGLADKKVFIVGLAFEFQMVKEIPVEKHDVRMDYIVTDEKIIVCS